MKGIQGLIVAVGLGVVAAVFNWAYLAARSHDVEKVGFMGIDPKVTVIGRGELLREEHLVEIGIPKQSVGKLGDFAVPYSTKDTVIGQPVWRALSGGMFLLAEDLKTPPQELRLADDEKAMWIPVETRAFVPSLITPGDLVSFVVTHNQAAPTPAVPGRTKSHHAWPDDDHRPVQDSLPGQPPGQRRRDAGCKNPPGPRKRGDRCR